MSQYITESHDFPYLIKEDVGGRMVVSGIFSLSDARNRNKRVYPRSLWERTLSEQGEFRTRLASRQVLGMLGHPSDGKTKLAEVSHVITNMWIDDAFNQECEVCRAGGNPHGHVMAEEEILGTPQGKVLQELYRAKVRVGISSRGQGSVRGGPDEQVVADDYKLETFDHVLDPSTPGAYPKVISESLVTTVEKLISPHCGVEELVGYRKVLADVVKNTQADDSRGHAQQLIEAIDAKLVSLTETENSTVGYTTVNPTVTYIPSTTTSDKTSGFWTPTITWGPQGSTSYSPSLETEDHTMSDAELKRLQTELATAQEGQARAESKLSQLFQEHDELRDRHAETARELELAKSLGEEAATKLRHTTFQLEGYREHVEKMSVVEMYDEEGHTVAEAFEKAKEIIERLCDQVEMAAEMQQRLEAAEDMVGRVRDRERRRTVLSAVDKILAQESVERATALKPLLLEGAETPEEVARKYSQLIKVATPTAKKPVAADQLVEGALPNIGSITEEHGKTMSTPAAQTAAVNHEQDFARRMLHRMAR